MNPPPIPPQHRNTPSVSSQLALASLIAPLLVVGLRVIGSVGLQGNDNYSQMMAILDLFAAGLILAGIIAAIIALSGIPTHGPKGILGRGIAGLVLNSLLMVLFVTNFVQARQKAIASNTAWQELKSTRNDVDSNINKSFDPKNGVTNFDPSILGKLSDSLKNVSQNSSGDEASIAKSLSAYADRTQTASKNYQTARTKLREAHVLNQFDSSDKTQLAARREIVQQFLDANAALKQVATNSEDRMRADLAADHVPNIKIDHFIEFYHASTELANMTTVKVRECDERVGAAMLDIFSILEAQWGHWKTDPAENKLLFDDADTRTNYNNDLATIKAAVEEQLKLQTQMLNHQQRSEP